MASVGSQPSSAGTTLLNGRRSSRESVYDFVIEEAASTIGEGASTIGSETTDGGSSCISLLKGLHAECSDLEGQLEMEDGSLLAGTWPRGSRIGVGSSGEVYIVRDAVAGPFAAKLVPPRDNDESAARLEQERSK